MVAGSGAIPMRAAPPAWKSSMTDDFQLFFGSYDLREPDHYEKRRAEDREDERGAQETVLDRRRKADEDGESR